MNYTKEQFERLPKWAQKEISSLERQCINKDQKIADLSAGPASARIRVHDYSRNPDQLLPNSEIRFFLGEGREDYRDMVAAKLSKINSTGPNRWALEISGTGVGDKNMIMESVNAGTMRFRFAPRADARVMREYPEAGQ